MTFNDWYYDSLPKRLPARIYRGVSLGKGSATRVLDKACTEVAALPIILPPGPPKRQYELPYWRKKKMERKQK